MQMADRNWENEIKFVTYRSASEAATQQFHVVQKFNEDTYLIAREKKDPDNEEKVLRGRHAKCPTRTFNELWIAGEDMGK
ncbi:Hypothetical protein PHPALM_3708 [Phytophthora palmivora]|uniref:Uncharacterized protein n=1 Tax=Phytophthora palmivora TaxID=4796 RepID=A0A2P4YLR5_9STRA|nr:Hypothetical protein PHPALM_3708 [Phytophthora palmivora]